MSNSPAKHMNELIKKLTVITPKDLEEYNIPRAYLARFVKKGLLIKVGRGIYTSTDSGFTQRHGLVQIARRIPHAVVALVSALRVHEIGTQNPHQVWIAIPSTARVPKLEYPPLRVFKISKPVFDLEIEYHTFEGVNVPVYSLEKTIVDCFKFRSKVGTDVALEALQEAIRYKRISIDKLMRIAEQCRVKKIIQPYAEALMV